MKWYEVRWPWVLKHIAMCPVYVFALWLIKYTALTIFEMLEWDLMESLRMFTKIFLGYWLAVGLYVLYSYMEE